MNSTAASHLTHDQASSDWYDDLSRNSPQLEPLRPTLQPSPSPPPPVPSPTVSSPANTGDKRGGKGLKARPMKPSRGDAILIGYLGGHRQNEVADFASMQGLPSEPESVEDTDLIDDSESVDSSTVSQGGDKERDGRRRSSGLKRMSIDQPNPEDMGPVNSSSLAGGGAFDLKSLAASALATVTDVKSEPVVAGPISSRIESSITGVKTSPPAPTARAPFAVPASVRRPEPFRDERPAPVSIPVATIAPPLFSPPGIASPHQQSTCSPLPLGPRSPTNCITSSTLSDGLAPLQLGSPRFNNTNGHTLPSIKSQLGDISQLSNNHQAAEAERYRAAHPMYARSPPGGNLPRLMHGPGSPPTSPVESFRRDASSPGQYPLSHSSPYPYANPNYSGSSTATPGSDHSAPTPGATGISIENHNHIGSYVCPIGGCNAQPFQTQYLLNSHMNVHSSSRPHYCPVPGCSRGEGGKGFKRKNEMIRHGLVHDSPGYVCPFCPDREHKYPRPDNLQRYVSIKKNTTWLVDGFLTF